MKIVKANTTSFEFHTDYHLLTPIAIDESLLPKTTEEVTARNAYYLGDNVDRKGCEDIKVADALYSKYSLMFLGRHCTGNHELVLDRMDVVVGNLLITHGDYALWGDAQALAFRGKSPAEGFGCFKKVVAKLRYIFPAHLSNSDKKNLAAYAKERNCNIIVFGHTHTVKIQDLVYNGVRMINIPRGKTILELEIV